MSQIPFCDIAGRSGSNMTNAQILREVGTVAYDQAVALVAGPDSERFKQLRETIMRDFIGPDCYWKDPEKPSAPGCKRFFGNAWFVPFPPTLVRDDLSSSPTYHCPGLELERIS